MSLTADLVALKEVVEGYARSYGLDFFDTYYEVLDFDQLNEVASFGGFPVRYPHWRFGMQFEELMKGYQWGLSKIYELVINNDPCYAYLMRSNSLLDQKLVMAHVYGHSDFFKNNMWFAGTNRKMVDQMANHGTRIRKMIDRFGLTKVETFLDACLSIENLIDVHSGAIQRTRKVTEEQIEEDELTTGSRVKKLESKDYMDSYINPPEYLEQLKRSLEKDVERQKRFPPDPVRDVLLFLIEHGNLAAWERDVLSIVREEAYYFAPQAMTKVMNEGWACLTGESLVLTDWGVCEIAELVARRPKGCVSDGETRREVLDWACFEERETVSVRTRRGYRFEGTLTHRVMKRDGSWCPLSEIAVGDELKLAAGTDLWAEQNCAIEWHAENRMTLDAIAAMAGGNVSTVIRCKDRSVDSRSAAVLNPLIARWESERDAPSGFTRGRSEIEVPAEANERFARFLGLLLSDGNISDVKRVVGFTSGDPQLMGEFRDLAGDLFGLEAKTIRDGNRFRVLLHSMELIRFLTHLGLPTGPSASVKHVPECILKSTRAVVGEFLKAYFDGDGYAGVDGVILVTASRRMAEEVQILLLNFGVLSSRRRQADGCFRLHVTGRSAVCFQDAVGFGLERKRVALKSYIDGHYWFEDQPESDPVVEVERGRQEVFDLTVEETHRYVAQGLIHHNSYWHSKIMTEKALTDSEIIDFADRHSGTMAQAPGQLNPYKLGIELFRDIEERWDRGMFGKEYEEEEDYAKKLAWDTSAGLGRRKIFEVRRIHNDVTFLDSFITQEFCEAQKLFVYRQDPRTGQMFIASRDYRDVKQELLGMFTNRGQPTIEVLDGNYLNRGELYLIHRWEGVDLRQDYALETLKNLHRIWKRPVHIETMVEEKGQLLSFDGEKVESRELTPLENQ